MKNQFLQELKWRGLIHDVTPEIEKYLEKRDAYAYIGFDPTSNSFHIGNLVQLIILIHFKKYGYNPIALIGGATGMIGDPSGKSKERVLLDSDTIKENVISLKKQLKKIFLATNKTKSDCLVLNNLSWIDKFSFIEFCRDIGKHISVNYMMSKESVKNRLESGISFTEFTYQLIQGYDFLWLWENKNVKIQFGGSDQWGNILTGNELIRKVTNGESYALTTPLITKSDGGKFGKTEDGNVWLDPEKTSPYKFYQFWINISDEDAVNFIKIFSMKNKDDINELIKNHQKEPHLRLLQNSLADEITQTVHDKNSLNVAKSTSKILFGRSTRDDFYALSEDTIKSISTAEPCVKINKSDLGKDFKTLLTESSDFKIFSSKSELIRMIKNNGLIINKEKVKDDQYDISSNLHFKKYLLLQKGKKNYTFIIVE